MGQSERQVGNDFGRAFRGIIIWWLVAWLAINAFSWKPGFGGRIDRQVGKEVERFFGWPACFYCDLWRSDHQHEVSVAAYIPPIPLTSDMSFAYCSFSFLGLLLDLVLGACIIAVVMLLKLAERHHRNQPWALGLGMALVVVALLIVIFGHKTSAYL